ncbi:hypothetical protein [Pseudomonas cichorii]|uniref:Aldehyde dehydrogenase n=1 Tax=Pseudomonas cichorii TaxID=36746 RepID=A0ABQ1DHD9_PSECI|nr:hypothetical protein [Pseudomonas cichorii]AHF67284.1 aldehyde dehydrogenase [Pseudomonas cichorii JBC1]QVE19151.1 hypothetical protein KGD89_10630 [Pseudomonas cichorii]GFM90427.1 hypothetical protein PSCICP_03990 [Pseudomonas cichorii]SDN54046.1 isoquinoline 1-oxidoreductase, beta subunit [Pseudomonas cichorii]
MSHPDTYDSVLASFQWQSMPDSNPGRKNFLLSVFAEQRTVAERTACGNIDQKDYLLALIDKASKPSTFDADRLRHVITEAADKGHWGKLSRKGRAQGIAAHYDSSTYMAVVLDVEVSDEGRLIIHEAVIAADLGPLESPGRMRSQLEGACLMGVALVTSCDIGPTTSHPYPVDASRNSWPLVSLLPRQIAVHLIDADQDLNACQPGQVSYVPFVRALCNAIVNAMGSRTHPLPFKSRSIERNRGS